MKKLIRLPESWSDAGALFGFKTATAVFNALPAADACKLGQQLVRLWLTFDRNHKQIIEKNLELALQIKAGSSASLELQTEINYHLGCNLGELFLLQNPHYRRLIQQNLQITGLQHLNKTITENSGAIVVGAHFGNWELAGLMASVIQKPITGVAKPIKGKPRLYAAITKTRQQVGLITVDKSDSAGTLVRILRKGGIVALLADQRARRRYRIWSPFFGQQVATIPSPGFWPGSAAAPSFRPSFRVSGLYITNW